MEFTVTDTLVLKIVEHESLTNRLDTTLYIFYDQSTETYVIRGKRRETPLTKSCTFSFECNYAEDLADFIEFVIDVKDPSIELSYVLYNYDNLPLLSNDVTYEFLQQYDDVVYEISGYDNQQYKRKKLLKYLRILRMIFNHYN